VQGYEIQALSERHEEALRMIAAGALPQEICDKLGLGLRMISYVRNSKAGQAFLERLRQGRNDCAADATEQLEALAKPAVEALGEALEQGVPHHVRIKAASEVLDRIGVARTTKSEHTVNQRFTGIEHIKQLAEELGTSKYAPTLDAVFSVVEKDEAQSDSKTAQCDAIEAQCAEGSTQ
jgi:hypothetical protein